MHHCVLESAAIPSELGADQLTIWDDALCNNNSMDEDLLHLVRTKPKKVSMSMLPSQKALAHKHQVERDEVICQDVEQSRSEVRQARMNFFKTAIVRDQNMISQIRQVPEKVKLLEHKKAVLQRGLQSVNGEAAVKGYLERFIHITSIDRTDMLAAEIQKMKSKIVACLQLET